MKKLLSVALAVLLIIGIMPIISTEVYAADYRIEQAIEWATKIANDDTHGYSMSSRHGPNYDCSSLVSYAFKNAGFAIKGVPNSSSMISAFSKVGFKAYKTGTVTPRRGDIYVQPGSHVELYIGNDTCIGAHENTDGKSGDSKGNEIDIRNISKCSWCRNKKYTYILRYEGPETYTYSFAYNTLENQNYINGFEALLSKDFTVDCSVEREGYTLSGWTVQRKRDNKWHTENGWSTEEEIFTSEGAKTVFTNGTTLTFSEEWTSSYSCDTQFVFYAVWTPHTYEVAFDACGGNNAPAPQIKLHGSDMTVTTVIPTKFATQFLGWAETPNATVPTYLPGAAYYTNAPATLYAVWGESKGDIYADGKLDTSDFALFKIMLSGVASITADEERIADVNFDGVFNTTDMAIMKLMLAGINP
ncbi:MAG: C40 family peptidase [Clostridia bacterium]|nr:C40 family peptidase [Clostridia bacterium]